MNFPENFQLPGVLLKIPCASISLILTIKSVLNKFLPLIYWIGKKKKKYIFLVFPYDGTEKPKHTFWPTWYFTNSYPSLGKKVKVKVLVTQSYPALWEPKGCSLPGNSVHGILQARILEWVAMPFSGLSSQLRGWTQVSFIASGFFTIWATSEAIFGVTVQIFLSNGHS